ncbi:MAG: response regulator transcription factor [Bacteroidia bacterium]|nr:response regulator transcription factor [Bacteroidia bacterium]
MKKVLIVEDDRNIADLLFLHLEDMDCEVDTAYDGKTGLEKSQRYSYSLIILDVMLPGMDGMEICRRIRESENYTPIMMLTAKSEELDKIQGLENGADDYLTKPFSVREFLARVKAIFRRQEMNQESKESNPDEVKLLEFGDLSIDRQKRKVSLKGVRKDLTPKEFDLLVLLASNPGRSYNREQLLNLVWGYEFSGYEHTVNAHVNRLRGKIEPQLDKPQYILTTWGVGYRFNDEL